ncbi:MAG: SDR family oxidoreductase [Verrucomicrobiota bacterium]|nr:SDR family oxidoreductase [Verrucomicrobiota bacterium]
MKRIFLTGASAGIGRAIAEQLCADGHEVWGTSRDQARLPQLSRLHPVALDLTDSQSITSAFTAAEAEAGGFDALINNAGSGHFGPAELLPRDALEREFQTLVFGQVQLLQLALRGMRARKCGTIVNVTSLASRLPVPFMASYSAAKAAMAIFTMSLNLELRSSGIRMVDVQPGDIHTNFNDAVTNFGSDAPDYKPALESIWKVVDENLRKAPPPEIVAKEIARVLAMENPPPQITVGDFFQARFAPFILRFLPMRVQLWGLRKFYGI